MSTIEGSEESNYNESESEINVNESNLEKSNGSNTNMQLDNPQASLPQGIDESGIEISANSEKDQENENEDGITLGDTLVIDSEKYGKITGIVYYLDSEKQINILPSTVSNKVYEFPIVDGEFDPDLGIKEIVLLKKGLRPYKNESIINTTVTTNKNNRNGYTIPGFIANQTFLVNQELLSYNKDGSQGPSYTITSIDESNDRMSLKDDSGIVMEIDFDFKGIPMDLPFKVLALNPANSANENEANESNESNESNEANKKDETQEEEDFFEFNDEQPLNDQPVENIEYDQGIIEIKVQDRIYSELIQKNELFSDFYSMLDKTKQQNPHILKELRIFVEMCSSLKNSIIKRLQDGKPDGELQISLYTLSDFLHIDSKIPLIRPVLKSTRVLYSQDMDNITYETNESDDSILIKSFSKTLKESEIYIKQQDSNTAGSGDSSTVGIPGFYRTMYGYFKQFAMGDKYDDSGFAFTEDSEYFRDDIPGSESLQGLTSTEDKPRTYMTKYGKFPYKNLSEYIGNISQSLRRAHGPTVRPLVKGGTDIYIPADKAKLKGHVMFPYKQSVYNSIGAIRTGSLWETMTRSMYKSDMIADLLKKLGEIQTELEEEDLDINTILYIPRENASPLKIQFSEYLRIILKSLIPRGEGDLATMKQDLGISTMETTLEQQTILQERVFEVQKAVRSMIIKLRSAPVSDVKPTLDSLFKDDNNTFFTTIRSLVQKQPLLNEIIEQMGVRTPGYKNLDIAIMASLFLYAKDYTLTAFGGMNPNGAEKARVQYTLEQYTKRLHAVLELETLKKNLGQPPQKNPCEHVDALELIRKVSNDTDRMGLLVKFVSKYKGLRDDNWVTCSVCDKHLLCQHEILQIQQFLYPKEQQILQKEIVLHYAGGLFGSNYICRNCGLKISDLEYDTSIEYDDEGKPMMGREVLLDKDFLEEEELKRLFSLKQTEDDDLNTLEYPSALDGTYGEIASIITVLSESIGVSLDRKGIRKIIDRVQSELTQTMPQDAYDIQKKLFLKEKKQRLPDYSTYLSRKKIIYTASYMLLEIQTHAPEYMVEFFIEGCSSPGFLGYPLIDSESPDKLTGIQYMACAIATIVRKESPWNDGFQTISKKDDKRKKTIEGMLFEYIKQQYTRNVTIQDEIQQKRKYIQTMYGDAAVKGRPSEKLPKNYLPRMEVSKDAAVAAASGPTISEGAKGLLGEILKADTWIRALNDITKKNTPVVPGSPFAETACCFSPITSPGKMIRESSLPPLPTHFQRKSGVSYESIVYTPMIARDLQRFNPTQSLELGYRVFLQLCWKGSRIGLPHEFGYDAKCDWCDIKIPTKYLYPDVNASGNPDIDEATIRSEIETQGVPITKESFQALLNASHIRTSFPVYTKRPIVPSSEVVHRIASIDPPPVENWSESIKQVQESIVNLPKDGSASRIELAHTFEPLRDAIDETVVLSSLGIQNNMILNSFLKESPQTIFEILRAYFLIPAKRLLNPKISDNSVYTTVDSYYDLASEHSENLKETLKNHTDYMVQLKQILFDENNVVKQTMENDYSILMKYAEQLTIYIKHGSEFRLTRLKYDESLPNLYIELFLKEIMRGIIFGPICTLLNTSSNFLKIFINTMLRKYSTEKLSYEPNTIRQILEEASEREKQRFIGDLDRMTTEERAIELTKKKLGVGRWAIGGSKLLFMYDKEQWEKNMEDNVRLYPSTAQPESSNDGYDVGVNHGDDD